MPIFRKKKISEPQSQKVSDSELEILLKSSLEKWKEIIELLKGDLGNIWLDPEIINFDTLKKRVIRIKRLIDSMQVFLKNNKINFPKIEGNIDELIKLLESLKLGDLEGLEVEEWFKEVSQDFSRLVYQLESIDRYNNKLVDKLRETKKAYRLVELNYRFISLPFRIGRIPIGGFNGGETRIKPNYGEVTLAQIPISAQLILSNISNIIAQHTSFEQSKKYLVMSPENLPNSMKEKIKMKAYLNDGGRSAISDNSFDLNLNIFGCNGIQEFRECRKGVGFVGDGRSEPVLPENYMNESSPVGGQYTPQGLWSIQVTDELLAHPEYNFKFCPTVYLMQISPELLETGHLSRYITRREDRINQDFLNKTSQEICLTPSMIRLGSFHPCFAYENKCYPLLQTLAPFPQQMTLIAPNIMADYINYFNLIARNVERDMNGIIAPKIGDIHGYFHYLSNVDDIPKKQPFIKDNPISKDIVVAQSGIYFKDLESLNLHKKIPSSIDPIKYIKLQMAYLFYDVGSCIEFMIALGELRKNNSFSRDNRTKFLEEIVKIRRVSYLKTKDTMWYDIKPNAYFLKSLIGLFNKSPYLFIKEENGNIALGIKTSLGPISFETYIKYGEIQ